MSDTRATRREFIRSTAALSAMGVAAVTAARAQEADAPAVDGRVRVGLIGCGGMGRANLAACATHPDVIVAGACDVWQERREAVCADYPAACKPYADFREMLDDDGIDAVIIATPPHWHCLIAVAACEAGKDLYIQKPMTLHLGESLAVRNAVREHGRISQVGTQIHAGENYRRVVELVRAGNLGPIGAVRTFMVMNQMPNGVGKVGPAEPPPGMDFDFWCGPAPLIPFSPTLVANASNHCSWMAYSGGWTPGMAPHIIDLPIWALDLPFPAEITSVGGRYVLDDDGDAYDHQDILWRYERQDDSPEWTPPRMTMYWWTSLINSYGFDFEGDNAPGRRLGVYFHGGNGTLYSDYGAHTVVPEGTMMDGAETPQPSIPPSPGHEHEWIDCVKAREQPSCCVDYHVKVDVPIVLSLLSMKLGRTIRFDPQREQIVADKEARELAVPEYRRPWRFPKAYL
jgi:predicted dehydrogenase